MTIQSGSSLLHRPGTKLGWWAFGLATVVVVIYIVISITAMPISELPIWMQFPFYYITFMFLCGVAAGVVGLIAVIRKHERS
jgi:hypothetical protein